MAARRPRLSIRPNLGKRGNKDPAVNNGDKKIITEEQPAQVQTEPGLVVQKQEKEEGENNIKLETTTKSIEESAAAAPVPRRRPRLNLQPRIAPRGGTKAATPTAADGSEDKHSSRPRTRSISQPENEESEAKAPESTERIRRKSGADLQLISPPSSPRKRRQSGHIPSISASTDKLPAVDTVQTSPKQEATNSKVKPTPVSEQAGPEGEAVPSQAVVKPISPAEIQTGDRKEKLTREDRSTVKPAVRVRSRFAKAKPNLAEAGRARIRHTSVSSVDHEEEGKHRSAPLRTSLSEHTEDSTPAEAKKDHPDPVMEEDALTQARQQVDTVDHGQSKPPHKPAPAEKGPLKTSHKMHEKEEKEMKNRRKMVWLDKPVDRSRLTMKDLIYMNPKSNPMKKSINEPEKIKATKEDNSKSDEEKRKESDEVAVDSDQEDIVEVDKEETQTKDPKEEKRKAEKEEEEDDAMPVPQVTIGPDGQIIINEASLVIDTPKEPSTTGDMEIVHEREDTLFTTGYGRKSQTKLWTERETKKFYLALSAVGTDFSLMCKLFPNRNRTELKRKFKREEKTNKYLIDKAILHISGELDSGERIQFDQDFFDELAALDTEAADREDKERAKAKVKSERARMKQKNEENAENNKRKRRPRKQKAANEDGEETISKPRKKKRKKLYYDESDEEAGGDAMVIDLDNQLSDDELVHVTAVNGENRPPGGSSDTEDIDMIKVMQKPTRVGRKPKPVKTFSSEESETKQRKKQHTDMESGVTSPPPLPGILGDRTRKVSGSSSASRTPGQFISLSNLSNVPNVNVNQMQPGSLLFVTSGASTTGEKSDSSGVIHVYLVSDQGGLQSAGGMNPGSIIPVGDTLPANPASKPVTVPGGIVTSSNTISPSATVTSPTAMPAVNMAPSSPRFKSILKTPPKASPAAVSRTEDAQPGMHPDNAIVIDARDLIIQSGDGDPASQASDSEGEYLIIDPESGSVSCTQSGRSEAGGPADTTPSHIYVVSDDPQLISQHAQNETYRTTQAVTPPTTSNNLIPPSQTQTPKPLLPSSMPSREIVLTMSEEGHVTMETQTIDTEIEEAITTEVINYDSAEINAE